MLPLSDRFCLLSLVFDSIGNFSPIMFQSKIIICKLCQQVVDWDQLDSPEISRLWSKFCSSYGEVSHASFFNEDLKF